jgi:hypothetical protein
MSTGGGVSQRKSSNDVILKTQSIVHPPAIILPPVHFFRVITGKYVTYEVRVQPLKLDERWGVKLVRGQLYR